MIARIWEGRVPAVKAEDYIELMRSVAIRDYRSTHGNISAWCLHREEAGTVVVQMLTFWNDLQSIQKFAGKDVTRARYYDFDAEYLIDRPLYVQHFDAVAAKDA